MLISYDQKLDELRNKLISEGKDSAIVDSIIALYETLNGQYLDNTNILSKSIGNSQLKDGVYVPIGGIIMWSGAIVDIPTGWHLCDGTGGTINLKNKFIVGAGDTYAVAATGGESTHSLSIAELAAHTHNSPGGYNFAEIAAGTQGLVSSPVVPITQVSATVTSTGSGTAHENKPPYYALAYIQRIS